MGLRELLNGIQHPPTASPWTLVAVGDPGLDNLERRRALGRMLLQQWGFQKFHPGMPLTTLSTGSLYGIHPWLQVFLPEVRNPKLGHACRELMERGQSFHRMVLVASDLRLTLGTGRLRLSGAADHPGVVHASATLQVSHLARLVFGIGPMVCPAPLFRAERWTPKEWENMPDLEEALDRFGVLLEGADRLSDLTSVVNAPGFWPKFREPRLG